MRAIYWMLGMVGFATAGLAQTAITLDQGEGYANDVFYSLSDGVVATVQSGNWDLAFDVTSPFSNAIRVNDGNGRELALYPGGGVEAWDAVDTAGFSEWNRLHNGLDSWFNGAFNVGTTSDPSDFGWGEYTGPPLHQVIGDSIYIIGLPDGSARKLRIDLLNMGEWTFTHAALDGSDEETVVMNMSDTENRRFLYYSFSEGWIDREPALDSWDFVLTRYVGPTTYGMYPTTGVLLNADRPASVAEGVAPSDAVLADFPVTDAPYTLIGNGWKTLEGWSWELVPDLSYFVQANNGDVYHLVFTSFEGSATGITTLNAELVSTLNVAEVAASALRAFPNPVAEGPVRLTGWQGRAEVTVWSASGRLMNRFVTADAVVDLNASNWSSGVYLVQVQDEQGTFTAQILKR